MMELKNTFPDLKLRGTEELIFNTFICVQFIFLIIIILYSAEDFFFKPLKMLFCCYFYFIACFLNQYPSTYGRRLMDLEAEGLLSIGLALQAETCA